MIADKIAGAGIPLIAIDIPHPHATFFGVDNYRVGFEAGTLLAQQANEAWGGKVAWVLGLDLEEAGPLVQSRITGAFQGVRILNFFKCPKILASGEFALSAPIDVVQRRPSVCADAPAAGDPRCLQSARRDYLNHRGCEPTKRLATAQSKSADRASLAIGNEDNSAGRGRPRVGMDVDPNIMLWSGS